MKKILSWILCLCLLACGAAAAEEDRVSAFSGEWLEKDTQFTVLDVTERIDNGWDIEITSPVSHGAWTIRAAAYYDSANDVFAYEDGMKYDLMPEGETPEKEAAAGLRGTLRLTGAEDDRQLEWHDAGGEAGETVVFERAPALPAYAYTGNDPIEGAVADALAKDSRAELYKTEKSYVTIPCPIIHKTEMTDDTHAKVYGSLWILNYVKRGTYLLNISGGEYPAVVSLEKAGDGWQVTAMEEAGYGEDYAEDIERFANGDRELEDQYFAGADLGSAENREIRTRFIREYVEANGLGITEYRDYGWDPVPLQ